ncbi:hypothetical protein A2767_07230 [Candidatus Roizmanbacteria bacterium RIFCSPHIGHO2_01_FULL_35_10]|uniref:Non-canonical purine NTP pyrophosphatase n=1 Tax=Candidatus Roizmanbacteria bacterium RIFCSPLOWO2_01_FULL_35_13 TaxID=1802055 RepID=A0A1F7I808_9BACT|nr:MAG: hypothetical protein A2767_07230 [Candidatus Roizmanbacteria bacterium RIFCSPHIGHO2_01_FULL_35_10]OGK39509.1 MAG: hypothetical protein A3A74_00620 [Candidatus Roizmanbacteria bacterium RIFCSPLOWO2_01_FULL_35_13]
MFQKILIATHNKAKLAEIKFGLLDIEKKGIKILALSDLKITSKPEETGKTFKENALLKAKFYAGLSNLPTIADDGGLIIPYLNNEPGVKSRRWLGFEATDEELIQHTLLHLKGVKLISRKAYLETCIYFYLPESNNDSGQARMTLFEQEKIYGHVAEKPYKYWDEGFPYRALLIVDKYNKYYDALTLEEHKQINHRLKALERLVVKISKYLLK